jgi:lysophospholipase L1-like esterase
MPTKLLLLIVSIFITLAFLEVGLRSYDVIQGQSFFRPSGNIHGQPMKSIVPFRMFGFDPYLTKDSERLISSRWGETYPYRKVTGTYRIVCFGGSTTEHRVEGVHYPLRLQTLLRERLNRQNIEVINVGNSAYATPHSIILLALDVVSWEPDLIIVSHNINDLLAMYFPGFRPDYWNKYAHEYYTRPDYAARYSWSNVVFQHSRLYWFLKNRIDRRQQLSDRTSKGIRRKSYGEFPLPEASAVFERNLLTFIAIAKRWNIETIIGNQPLQPSEKFFLRHMRYKPYNDVVIYPYHEEFVLHHQAFNRIAEDVAASAGVGFVDNAKRLNGEEKYFMDYVHYSREGIMTLADNYANFIIAHNMIRPSKNMNIGSGSN